LSSTRRGRIHRRIGELLEADCGADPGERVGDLAHHWAAATGPPDVGKAVSYARKAGQQALAGLAPDDAIRWFSQALGQLDGDAGRDPLQRLDVLIDLGEAQRQAGDPRFRQTLLD